MPANKEAATKESMSRSGRPAKRKFHSHCGDNRCTGRKGKGRK